MIGGCSEHGKNCNLKDVSYTMVYYVVTPSYRSSTNQAFGGKVEKIKILVLSCPCGTTAYTFLRIVVSLFPSSLAYLQLHNFIKTPVAFQEAVWMRYIKHSLYLQKGVNKRYVSEIHKDLLHIRRPTRKQGGVSWMRTMFYHGDEKQDNKTPDWRSNGPSRNRKRVKNRRSSSLEFRWEITRTDYTVRTVRRWWRIKKNQNRAGWLNSCGCVWGTTSTPCVRMDTCTQYTQRKGGCSSHMIGFVYRLSNLRWFYPQGEIGMLRRRVGEVMIAIYRLEKTGSLKCLSDWRKMGLKK